MNRKHSAGPKTFGERFRNEGLLGALKKKRGKSQADPNAMHFLEHLEELRWVLVKCVCAFIVGCLGIAIFMQDSVKVLQIPLIKAVEDFGEIGIDLQSIGLEEYKEPLEQQQVELGMLRNAKEKDLTTWGITNPHHQTRILTHFANGQNRNLLQVIRSYSPIFIAMKICFLGGIGISLPAILYFVGGFVVPGLTPKEKRVFFPGCVAATFLFITGASMTYLFILPLSLAFTIEFSFNVLGLDVYRPEAGNYYSTVIWMTFAVGIAFQFPLVLVLLIRIGVLSVAKLRDSRRIVLVILMVSAALITPGGDPVSLCILTIPLYILYEFAILVGSVIEGRKARREWNEWDESIQGDKPAYPEKKQPKWWVYAFLLFCISCVAFALWKFQDQLEHYVENFSIWADTNQSSPHTQNLSGKPINLPLSVPSTGMESQETFLLQLTPLSVEGNLSATDANHSKTELYEAKILLKP
jgi:sec-independent protein translocase protein TatC